MDRSKIMYTINDSLGQLAVLFDVPFIDQKQEDDILDDLTHEVAKAFHIGTYADTPLNDPYMMGYRIPDSDGDPHD